MDLFVSIPACFPVQLLKTDKYEAQIVMPYCQLSVSIVTAFTHIYVCV